MSQRLLAVLFCTLLGACGTSPDLSEPAKDFRAAVLEAVPVARGYMLRLNAEEREYQAFQRKQDPALAVGQSLSKAPFSPEGIAARLEALALLNAYVERLGEIMALDPSEQLSTNSEALSESLKGLGGTIGGLAGNPNLGNYAGPVSALAEAVAAMWIESERAKALRTAVTTAAPQIDRLAQLLVDDVRLANEDRINNLEIQIGDLIQAYDTNAANVAANASATAAARPADLWTEKHRLDVLSDIESKVIALERMQADTPSVAFQKMREAHAAMLKAAQNPEDNDAFSELVTSVKQFSAEIDRARTLYAAFRSAG